MLSRRFRVNRRRPSLIDVQVSDLRFFINPLKKLGFRFTTICLAFPLDESRPTGAFCFQHADKRRLYLYYSRADPFRFSIIGKKRVRSPDCPTLDDLERHLCHYFKTPKFLPAKRPVTDWPIRKRNT